MQTAKQIIHDAAYALYVRQKLERWLQAAQEGMVSSQEEMGAVSERCALSGLISRVTISMIWCDTSAATHPCVPQLHRKQKAENPLKTRRLECSLPCASDFLHAITQLRYHYARYEYLIARAQGFKPSENTFLPFWLITRHQINASVGVQHIVHRDQSRSSTAAD